MTELELQRRGCAVVCLHAPEKLQLASMSDSVRVVTDDQLGRMLAKDDGLKLTCREIQSVCGEHSKSFNCS